LQEYLDDHNEAPNQLFDDLANEYLNELFKIKPKDEDCDIPVRNEYKEYFNLLLERF